MRTFLRIALTTVSLYGGTVIAQIPVEVFAGSKNATMDLMFFKFFRNSQNESSRFLFFNRNRVNVDYKMTGSENLPQFGFTEALSYNHEKLKGIAPVFVFQVFNSGLYSKAGVQYVHLSEKLTLFTWLVSETVKEPAIDYYILFRYTPEISDNLQLFTQIESLNTFQSTTGSYHFTQRLRLGLAKDDFQFGLGADLGQRVNESIYFNHNPGIFLRYVFKNLNR